MAPVPDVPTIDPADTDLLASILIQIAAVLPLVLFPFRPASPQPETDNPPLLYVPAGVSLAFIHGINVVTWIIKFCTSDDGEKVGFLFNPPPWTWQLCISNLILAEAISKVEDEENRSNPYRPVVDFAFVIVGFQMFWYMLWGVDPTNGHSWALFLGFVAVLVLIEGKWRDEIAKKLVWFGTENIKVLSLEGWSDNGEKNEKEKRIIGYRVFTTGLVAAVVVAAHWMA
ncbi:hypothetical protein OQA88_3064 [Cercophora sp. LCS_1]